MAGWHQPHPSYRDRPCDPAKRSISRGSGCHIRSPAFITPPGLLYVSAETAERLKGNSTPPLKVSRGCFRALRSPTSALPEGAAGQAHAGFPICRLAGPADGEAGALRGRTRIVAEEARRAGRPQPADGQLPPNLTAFGFLAFAVGLFIVYSTIGLAFEQRRPTFRTLRSLGIPATTLMGLLLVELLIVAVFSGLMGVALGYILASFLLPGVAVTLRSLYGASVDAALTFRSGWVLSGLAIAVAGTLLSAAQSLLQISRMPLLAPAQPRAWAGRPND